MFERAYLEWGIFILLFAYGIYTMIVIKNEKKNYLKEAKEIQFKHFKLLIPKWWGEVPTENPNHISFKRLDTRYEWEANFIWSDSPTDKEIRELFVQHISERKIIFDEDTSIIYNPSDFKTGALILSGNYEIVRLEGTATHDRADRLYYDAFLVKNKNTNQYLYAESKSSVLNGLVEGPYFEEVMERIELIS
jgi:hypothetical protein